MDVMWFHLSRRADEEEAVAGRLGQSRILVLLDRGDYWQVAYVISKGTAEKVKQAGLDAFRRDVAGVAPDLADRVHELRDWDQIKLLTVQVNRLRKWWRPGLLCIGDAAHAMSPVGGVGVNLAVQDAVAAANRLAAKLRDGAVGDDDLAAVQRRREWPTRVTQRLQFAIQNSVIAPALGATGPPRPPALLRWLTRTPLLRRIPARLIGLGVRPEHVRSPAAA